MSARHAYLGEPDIKDAETIVAMLGPPASSPPRPLRRLVGTSPRASRPISWTRSGTSSSATTAPTPRCWATGGYPKSLCTSLNEVICNGLPVDTVIADGDIINIHITVYIGGVHGATDAMFLAGEVDPESELLVERTREAMNRGIKAVAPGRPLRTVGLVIEKYARRFGYGVVRDFTGHGIGKTFHSGLIVPHYDDPRNTVTMEPGMTFTIEPMLTLGTVSYDIWEDGWTAATKDRKRTAQFEHTILVTEDGHEILTLGRAETLSTV